MADREFLLNFLARDQASPVIRRVGDAVDDLGDDMRDVSHEASGLDREIDQVQAALRDLAVEFARTDDAAKRIDLTRAMRAQQTELRKLTKARDWLPTVEDVTPEAHSLGMVVGKQLTAGAGSTLSLGPLVAIAAASALPLLGAATAAAVVGAAGAGGIVGGIILAAKDPRVKTAATDLKTFIGEALQTASQPFVPATLDAIDRVKKGFTSLRGDIAVVFSDSAKLVSPLVDGIVGLVRNVMPGIKEAIGAAGPIFSVLREELPKLGETISGFLSTMAEHADQGAAALKWLFFVLETGIEVLGPVVGFFGDLFEGIVRVEGAVLSFVEAFAALTPIGEVVRSVLDPVRQKLLELQGGMDASKASTYNLGSAVGEMAVKLGEAVAGVTGLKTAIDDLTGKNVSLMGAQIAAAEAVAHATETIKENGRSTDLNSKSGRENQAVLLTTAQRFNDLQTAAEASGESADDVKAAYDRNRAKLISMAQGAGYAKDKAVELADKILQIPTARNTRITADTGDAMAKINAVRNAIASIGRGVAAGLSGLGQRAAGGPVRKGEAYIVGEKRPEVFVPDRDGTIIPSIDQATGSAPWNAPASGGGAVQGPISVRVLLEWVSGGSQLAEALIDTIKPTVLSRGGDVQVVLGKG